MVLQEHLPLWNKIQGFPIDDGTAVVPFSAKLAASQRWSPAFTQIAIEEYRKFLLLCCINEKGASPSKIVDEVWHLHLTYTRSYWIDLCRNTLGKDIHHHPSAGGQQEDDKHRGWYKGTLALYRTVFDMEPPSEIWPPPRAEWPVPEDPPFNPGRGMVLALIAILASPFLYMAVNFHTFSPFTLGGPHFLAFLPLYGVAIIAAYVVCRWQIKKKIEEIVDGYFPYDITAFQMACFLYGKHRSFQVGIVDLLNRDLLEVTSDKLFRVKKDAYRHIPGETNPLIPAFVISPDGSEYTYEDMMANCYDHTMFSHPALDALQTFARRRESFLRAYLFHIAFFGLVFSRAIQGLVNDRPITFLILQALVVSIVFFVAVRQFAKSVIVYREMKRLLKAHRLRPKGLDDRMLRQFALEGFPAINGSTEGLLLTGIFAAYTPGYLRDTWHQWHNGMSYNNSGGSCGGGSSCGGGGGSCGGGGCGGCGGGD